VCSNQQASKAQGSSAGRCLSVSRSGRETQAPIPNRPGLSDSRPATGFGDLGGSVWEFRDGLHYHYYTD